MAGIAPIWAGYPRWYSPGRNRPVQYVVMHYTAGNAGPLAAEDGVAYDKRRNDQVSCHIFADSAGAPLQEVPLGDRAYSAYQYGNEIGVHIEICDTRQTREQWLDEVSYPALVAAAGACRWVCDTLGIPLRRLTVAEVHAAYFAPAGQRPFGICDHAAVTYAYGLGDHTDVGEDFPWDVFMQLVVGDQPPEEDDVKQLMVREGPTGPIWLCDGMWRRKVQQTWLDPGVMGPITNHRAHMAALLGNLQTGTPGNGQAGQWEGTGQIFVAGETGDDMDIWGLDVAKYQITAPGGGLSFDDTVNASEQGARLALTGATITPA